MSDVVLVNGGVSVVDELDFGWLSRWRWYFNGRYAIRTGLKRDGEKQVGIFMHRQILGVVGSEVHVDHINHNPLDNRRENLRLCSRSQNQSNRLLTAGSLSGFKGVSYLEGHKTPWQARVNINGKQEYLGCFATKEQAALAYNEAAKQHFGEFACLNEVVI